MKNLSIFQKVSIITIFVILGIIVTVVTVNLNNKSDAETIAKAVLNKTYGITLADSKKLANAITQSSEDNTIFIKYLHSIYEGQMTDNGYNAIINNRVPSKILATITEENSDLKVTSIQLKGRDAVKENFDFLKKYIWF